MVRKYSFLIMVLLVMATFENYAQSGSLTGIVKDAVTGTPLPGANVFFVGTSVGTATELEGNFSLRNIEPGTYLLRVRYIGYKEIDDSIIVFPGLSSFVEYALQSDMVETEEVIISAQAQGQIKAINQQISARNIKNVVSADRMQEIPDANLAESLGRLPGVSIARNGGEANQVIIRGLSPKYNNVSVEGVQMASTDQGTRAVGLAAISSNTLAGVEISKAITPDMDANALGGSVNLKMREAKPGFKMDYLLQGGYNGHDELYDDFKFTGTASNRFMQDKLGTILSLNYERINRGNDVYSGNWEKTFNEDYPLNGARLSLRDTKEVRKRLGATLVLDYEFESGSIKFSNFYSHLDRDVTTRSLTYALDGNRLNNDLIQQPEIKTDQMINSLSAEFQTIMQSTLDLQFSHSLSNVTNKNQSEWAFSQQVSYDLAIAQRNDFFRDINKFPEAAAQGIDYDQAQVVQLDRPTRDTEERNYSAALNWKIPFTFGSSVSGNLKMGGKYNYKKRVQDVTNYYVPLYESNFRYLNDQLRASIPELVNSYSNGALILGDFLDNDFKVNNFLDGDFEFAKSARLDILGQIRNYILNSIENDPGHRMYIETEKSIQNDYDGYEAVSAGYLMAEFNLLENKLMILPGVRYEHEVHKYSAALFSTPGGSAGSDIDPSLIPDTTAGGSNEFWLPMIHINFKPLEWLNIRFAQTKSLTRPNFTAVIPLRYLNTGSFDGRGGDPSLKPASSWNTDVSISVYSNYVGLFTVSGFYKDIKNLIWRSNYYIPKGTTDEFGLPEEFEKVTFSRPVNNKYNAYLHGFEVEWQTSFWYLPSPLNGIVFSINYSNIYSETKYPRSEQRRIGQFPNIETVRIDTCRTGRMEDQPSDLFNFSVGYDIKGFSARLSYYYQTNTLTSIGNFEYQDTFSEAYSRWDLNVRQELPWAGLKAFLNITNITDTPDKAYKVEETYITNIEYYGMSVALGLQYFFK